MMSITNILVFAVATCAFVAVIVGIFWLGEKLLGAQARPVVQRHLPLEHPEDQR